MVSSISAAVFTLAAYVLGSFPTAYIVGKRRYHRDITKIGSKNVGALNTWKELGWKPGLFVLVVDTIKGVVVMAAILLLGVGEALALAAAIAVTIGHNFSFFLKFKGGKGLTVVFGLSIVILPLFTLISVAALLVVFFFTRSIVWAFFVSLIILNWLTIATGQPAAQVGLCIILSVIVVATHFWRTRYATFAALRKFDLVRLGKIQ